MPAQQSNLCDDMQPWLAAYALGDADDEEAPRAHLAACPRCQHDLQEYRLVAGLLPYSAPESMPRPELREQVIGLVERHAAQQALASLPRPAMPAPEAPAVRPRRPRSFWAALAFASLALALLGWNITLQGELNRQTAQVAQNRQSWQTMIALLNDSSLRWYALAAQPSDGSTQSKANGHFWATPRSLVACLVAQDLPNLPAGEVYQIWLMRGGELASGGTFEARGGNAWTFVRADEPLVGYSEIFVTVEPEGGSPAPAGPRVMGGTLSVAMIAGIAERQELLDLLRGAAPLGM
jgi:anti-sigma factor RsiW